MDRVVVVRRGRVPKRIQHRGDRSVRGVAARRVAAVSAHAARTLLPDPHRHDPKRPVLGVPGTPAHVEPGLRRSGREVPLLAQRQHVLPRQRERERKCVPAVHHRHVAAIASFVVAVAKFTITPLTNPM